MEMCRLAFSHVANAEISELEIKRGGKSYTALTLAELSSEEHDLYFLCGTDMFLTLGEWYMPEEIFKLATICYVRRERDEKDGDAIKLRTKEYVENFGARIIPISASVTEVSSSEIRRAIKEGDARIAELLPKAVFDYIKDRRLYK
jgi:nicotinate-nucleotide adenylyltransferase